MDYEFISCDRQLPPTECPLVIELPIGTEVYRNQGGEEAFIRLTHINEVAAHRVNHIETKDRDMRFEIGGGMWVVGRFGWTYP